VIIISNNNLHINELNSNVNNQENARRPEFITIGRLAPDFTALSTQGYIRLSDYRGKWVLLSSHPMAFAPVSTTEIIAAAQNYSEFQKRNVQLLSITTDNNLANLAWINDISRNTGIAIPFPIISDRNYAISELYGMLNPDRVYEESVRDSFIISPAGKIRAIITLPVSSGRGVYEFLRVLDSLQLTEEYNLYTPSGWYPGEPVVVPPPNTYDELVNTVNNGASLGLQCPFWYLCYTNINTAQPINTNN